MLIRLHSRLREPRHSALLHEVRCHEAAHLVVFVRFDRGAGSAPERQVDPGYHKANFISRRLLKYTLDDVGQGAANIEESLSALALSPVMEKLLEEQQC
jgi:hypothetical protein